MHRARLLFLVAITQTLSMMSVAEVPQDLDEVLFGLSGCEDYSLWMRSVGVVKFHTPIGIFNEAEFFSRQEHPEWAPTHCRILMRSTLDGSQSFSNVVSSIKSVEDIFLKTAKFKGKMFVRNESLAGYFSVCTNIDNCGWTAAFTVQRDHNHFDSAQSWRASAEFQKDMSITNACDEVHDALMQYPCDLYKYQVESINAKPADARRQRAAYEALLDQTVKRLLEENRALDRKGGPHDLWL